MEGNVKEQSLSSLQFSHDYCREEDGYIQEREMSRGMSMHQGSHRVLSISRVCVCLTVYAVVW